MKVKERERERERVRASIGALKYFDRYQIGMLQKPMTYGKMTDSTEDLDVEVAADTQ